MCSAVYVPCDVQAFTDSWEVPCNVAQLPPRLTAVVNTVTYRRILTMSSVQMVVIYGLHTVERNLQVLDGSNL
jgi:hypothetical protein